MKSNDFLRNKAAEAQPGECAAVMNIEDPLKPHSNYWEMLGPTKYFHVVQDVKYEVNLSFAMY